MELIKQGEYFLNISTKGVTVSNYHIEAAIAFLHTKKEDNVAKWEQILQLYNRLLQVNCSPVIALNRTYALFKVHSRAEALKEALKINLSDYYLYHILVAELYGDEKPKENKNHLKLALSLATNDQVKSFIKQKLKSVS